MYHALTYEKQYQNRFFISPKIFEKDLKYLKENNYSTVTIRDLINYVDNGVPLPEKPVLITFDDGYYNNYLYAYPLLRQYNMKAVISVIGSQTDKYSKINNKNSYYAYLTWNDIAEIEFYGSGGVVEPPVTSVSLADGAVTVANAPATCILIIASYNGTRLIDAKAISNATGSYTIANEISTTGSTSVKAFLWDNITDIKPLCDSAS
jgi:hypothetical protein